MSEHDGDIPSVPLKSLRYSEIAPTRMGYDNIVQLTRKKTGMHLAPSRGPTENLRQILVQAKELDRKSKYDCHFDYSAYEILEKRFKARPIRGGIAFKSPFKLVNFHAACQECLYAFEIDAYGRGCSHDCIYCYGKAELTVHGYWNNPIPVPMDINIARKLFYTVFETDKKTKWREVMERKIPLRIGAATDSFMFMDKKYKVTQELLKILKYYRYPYIIATRSDLVAYDEYMELFDRELAAIQISLCSINDELNRQIEPGAPSAKRRLLALQKLAKAGFWTTVRVNPLFPIYPDGYFSDPNFSWVGEVPKFDYTSFDIVDAIADHGIPAMLAGFVRLSSFALNSIQRATGINLRPFFNRNSVCKSRRDWHYSDNEIRYYYEQLRRRALKRHVQFTTCYIGNGESHFWKDQDLWSNKGDCCNAKGKVRSFESDTREILFESRRRISSKACAAPISDRLHEPIGEDSARLFKLPIPRSTSREKELPV